MASQVAIKMLGTNGGGYVNANAAHPFENPTPLSNFIQMLSIFSIGSGMTYYLLLPICLVFAVFLVSQGMIQNFKPYTKATLVEPM